MVLNGILNGWDQTLDMVSLQKSGEKAPDFSRGDDSSSPNKHTFRDLSPSLIGGMGVNA
jgi:hypothetical protein